VTRIGTQVVVRLSGQIDGRMADQLRHAVQEVAAQVISRVLVDLADVHSIEGVGIDFLGELNHRWRLRVINRPGGLGVRLPAPARDQPSTRSVAGSIAGSSARSRARSSAGEEWVSAPTER
jgi:hypothetical protein